MTENFDNFINQLLTEAKRCNGPSLLQLSDKPEYRFMKCAPNPFSPGYKRIYLIRKGEKVDIAKCLKHKGKMGTKKGEECRIALKALRKKLSKLKKKK